jgi:hypothetical protein
MEAFTDQLSSIWQRLNASGPLANLFGIVIPVFGIIGGTSAWLRRKHEHLTKNKYVAKIVKSKIAANMASASVHKLWPGDPLLSEEQYWNIIQYNENVLVSIYDNNNIMRGFFDVFPLENQATEAFLQGKTTEEMLLSPQTIYKESDHDLSNYIYIGTVLGFPSGLRGGQRRSEKLRLEISMIRPLLKYLNDKFPPRAERIYFAMGSTQLGDNWLRECGFVDTVIPEFGKDKKFRRVYVLHSKDIKAARRKAYKLNLKAGERKLIHIQCAWHSAAHRWPILKNRI